MYEHSELVLLFGLEGRLLLRSSLCLSPVSCWFYSILLLKPPSI